MCMYKTNIFITNGTIPFSDRGDDRDEVQTSAQGTSGHRQDSQPGGTLPSALHCCCLRTVQGDGSISDSLCSLVCATS